MAALPPAHVHPRQLVLLAERQAGTAAAAAVSVGARRSFGPRAEAGRLGEGGGGVGGDVRSGGAQAEWDGRLAHPPAALQAAGAAAVPGVELDVKRALLLLLLLPAPQQGRALVPAARGAPLAGVQHVGDPPQPALLRSAERRRAERPGAQEEAPAEPSHFFFFFSTGGELRAPRCADPRSPRG